MKRLDLKTKTGEDFTVLYDTSTNTYTTEAGDLVLPITKANGDRYNNPSYEWTGKKVRPGKKGYVIYKGVVYKDKIDYEIKHKEKKDAGVTSTATITWKKSSSVNMTECNMSYTVSPKRVNSGNAFVKNGKGKLKIKVKDGGFSKKLNSKKDYVADSSDGGTVVSFKGNYTGRVNVSELASW